MTSPSLPTDQLNYEEAMRELEKIIDRLETAQSSLQESLDLFERGQILAQHCAALLDQAELRVRQVAVEEDAEAG
jgi:exodeoxyribonuclease VII small subunit